MENDQTSIVSRPIRGRHPNVGTVQDTMKKPRYVSGGGAEVLVMITFTAT
jgi:hypothetical protein